MKYLLLLLLIPIGTVHAQSAEYNKKKEQKLSVKSPFEKIIDRELPATIVYENEYVIGFVPLGNQAPVHYLIVPKKRIPTVNDVTEEDAMMLGHMFIAAREIAKEFGVAETGYRLAINNNEDSGQSVFHIHMHLLGGMETGPMVDQTWRNEQKAKKEE
ncbi:MAG: histidine triad nucleotide-binding protein [Cyclobacteriaceae bacterium]